MGHDDLLEKLHGAVQGQAEGQVFVEHVTRVAQTPALLLTQRIGGWRIDGKSELSEVPPPHLAGNELAAWLAEQTRAPWSCMEMRHGRRLVAQLFICGPTEICTRLRPACELATPFFAAVSDRRPRRDQEMHLAKIAHDLKQPLHGLRFSLEDLSVSSPGTATSRALRAVAKLTEMVDQLTNLQAEQGLTRAPMDVVQLARDLMEDHRRFASERSIGLELEGAPRAVVVADRLSLSRALLNVIHNAILFSPAHSVVRLRVRSVADAVLIDVSDSGPGIPDEHRTAVFTPFFTTRTAGTGLGLAVSKSVIEAHGGRVSISARPGCTVSIELPAADLSR